MTGGKKKRAKLVPKGFVEVERRDRMEIRAPTFGVTQGRESGGSGFEACSGLWSPRLRTCGVAINTLVDLKKLAG